MKNVEINRVGNTRFVNIPGVGVGMYSGMVGTFSAGNLSKTWEVEPGDRFGERGGSLWGG